MGIKTVVVSARFALGIVAVASTLFAGNVAAREYDVRVGIHVSTQGLDLGQPSGAQQLYQRIQRAAYIACTYGNRVDLKPAGPGCYEQALGGAVRAVHAPLLTQIYLETHTLRQAAVHGIEIPAQVAAK